MAISPKRTSGQSAWFATACGSSRAVLPCAELHSALPLRSGPFRVDIAWQATGDEPSSGLNTQKRK